MNLDLTATRPHHLHLHRTQWDDTTECIALILDGINDHRTPALTLDEARGLALRLLTLVDSLDGSGGTE